MDGDWGACCKVRTKVSSNQIVLSAEPREPTEQFFIRCRFRIAPLLAVDNIPDAGTKTAEHLLITNELGTMKEDSISVENSLEGVPAAILVGRRRRPALVRVCS